MTTETHKICRLCFEKNKSDMIKIEDIHQEMLDVLLIQLDWSISENPLLCGNCLTKMQDYFAFKSNCIDIEDYLIPFRKNDKLDLRNVYKKKAELQSLPDAEAVLCRLCIELTGGSEVLLNETDTEKFTLYLPEINLELTSKLVCSKCHYLLQNYFNFTDQCLKNEQKLRDYRKIIQKRRRRPIFLDKFLEYSPNTSLPSDGFQQPKGRRKRSKNSDHKCDVCSYETNSITTLQTHKLSHVSVPDSELFKCTMCTMQTKYQGVLNHHMKTNHSDHRYCCNECSFMTKHRISIRRHLATHNTTIHACKTCKFKTKHASTMKKHVCKEKKVKTVLQCPNCPYKTIRGSSLKQHSLRHKSPSEIPMHNCDLCDFKSKYRKLVVRHRLVHQKPEETIYKCPLCKFNTFTTWSLNLHIKTHDSSLDLKNIKREEYIARSVGRSHKCTQCDFASLCSRGLSRHITYNHNPLRPISEKKRKRRLTPVKNEKLQCSFCEFHTYNKITFYRHSIRHRDPAEVRVYKCDQCSFQTKWADSFKNHKNLHMDPSEVVVKYHCPICTFKTIHRRSIISHKKVRHNSKAKMYKCKKCDFQSKWYASVINHQIVHTAPHLSCEKCDFKTKYVRSLRNHIRDIHSSSSKVKNNAAVVVSEIVQCAECMHKFNNKNYLVAHIRRCHKKDTLYKCDKCPFVAYCLQSVKQHQITHEDKDNMVLFECNLCDYKSKNKRILKNHISNRHEH